MGWIKGALAFFGVGFAVACGQADACDNAAPADGCHAPSAYAPGPLAVGVTTLELDDASRSDAQGLPRHLRVEVWYPADASSRSLARDVYSFNAEAPPALQATLGAFSLVLPEQDAARDAAPDRRFAPYPILTFSHGKNGIRFQTQSLMVHLASHGFVVVAPDHTGDTVWELLSGANLADHIVELLVARPKDVVFAAESVAASSGPLAGLADLASWGTLGHSFGGTTSIVLTAAGSEFWEPRVRAAMPITPAVRIVQILGAGPDTKGVPMWLIGGVADQTVDFVDEQRYGYDIAPAPKGITALARAGHFSFTDLCGLDWAAVSTALNLDAASVLSDGCDATFEDPAVVRQLVGGSAAAFFSYELRGSPSAAAELQQAAVPASMQGAVQLESSGI